MSFGPGSVVKLKSGGPPMTVEKVDDDPLTGEVSVSCVWFDEIGDKKVLQARGFSPAVLVKVEPRAVTHAPPPSSGSVWSA